MKPQAGHFSGSCPELGHNHQRAPANQSGPVVVAPAPEGVERVRSMSFSDKDGDLIEFRVEDGRLIELVNHRVTVDPVVLLRWIV